MAALTTTQQPSRTHVALAAGGNITVPLATVGHPEAVTSRIYTLLGVEMQEIRVNGTVYTVPFEHLVVANDAICAAHAGGTPLAGQTCQVPVANVTVPYWQPQVGDVMAKTLAILGVNTVNLVFAGVTYTVLTTHLAYVRACFTAPAPAPVGAAPAPTMVIPVSGVTLQEFYRGAPSDEVQVLARLFGAHFMCLVDKSLAHYWVLAERPTTDATIRRLGLLW